jgi:hypothetical protein
MKCSCNSSGVYKYDNDLIAANSNKCPDQYGCIKGVCPDFVIRRHDTKPDFRVKIEDCDGPMDLTDLVLEATMWAKGKLKNSISEYDTYFALADNIGFNQIMVGDIIIMDQARLPEKMLVTAFDETNRLVQVQRAYHGTIAQRWKKGNALKIIKFMNATANTEMIYEDVLELDGTTTPNVLMESYFIYHWNVEDTCLPGCYYFEFKLIKMKETSILLTSDTIIPSFTDISYTPSNFGCGMSEDIEWIRRFPLAEEGFLIKITDTFTSES